MKNIIEINTEIRDIIIEEGGIDIYKCYQCGKCISVCPWFKLINFPVYRVPQKVRLGAILSTEEKEEIDKEVDEVYKCVGCEACFNECPRKVSIPTIMRAIRRILVNYGSYPQELKSAVSKIYNSGNPFGKTQEERTDWAKDLNIPEFNKSLEYLYFAGCIPAYDRTNIAKSTAVILKKANISFGIYGNNKCCCEAIRKVGAEKVFKELAQSNIKNWLSIGVKKIITTCPHCYNLLKNEMETEFEVYHITQIFANLIREGKIKPTDNQKPLNVVYHDPCILGRQNKIYDEPRFVLKSIPEIKLLEVENFSYEYSICCGGGSGGLWLDIPINERITIIRIKQLADTGANIIAVACPYCMIMFEDAVKTLNIDIKIMDIAELLAQSL